MYRKKILWLVSWYPNRKDNFDGDFVQRHARAAAVNHDICVLFVTDLADLSGEEILNDSNEATGLTEEIYYFKTPGGLLQTMRKQWKWLSLSKKLIRNYIAQNGKPDLVHVHIPWKAGILALWLRRKYEIPYLITEHWGIYNNLVPYNYDSRSVIFKRLLVQIFRQSETFTTVSKYLGEAVNKTVIHKNYRVIPNVVDTSLFYYKERPADQPFTFLHVSNMVPLKNVGGILEAFYKMAQDRAEGVRLLLIGNRSNQYTALAESYGLLNKNVFFLGEVPYREVAEQMQQAHCFVLNSTIENAPCVISEALCTGLPVITTAVGGIPELVDESNSLLVPVNDPLALANAMSRMINKYAVFNPIQIAAAAAARFSYSKISDQFDQLYTSYVDNSLLHK